MKTVLVTGFEPFGGERINPSALAAQAVDGMVVAGRRVAGVVLPCVFGASLLALRRGVRRLAPELVVCAGQAGGSCAIAVERVAINVDDASIADNAGAQPVDRPIARGGPAAYWATLPIKAIVAALRDANIPAEISQSAGTFVCNHLFYGLMHTLAGKRGVRGGFIHVPYLPEQANGADGHQPSLPLDQIVRALRIAIETSITTKGDIRAAGGATH